MPSFDIVSEVESAEILNATENSTREIATRFDFRGVDATISVDKDVVTIKAEADFQCEQLVDMFRTQLIKRKVDPSAMDVADDVVHRGKTFSVKISFKQGVETLNAKKIVKLVKQEKLKVQAAIQGDQVRITGKKRDDLQAVMALVRSAELGQPFQFTNFRD